MSEQSGTSRIGAFFQRWIAVILASVLAVGLVVSMAFAYSSAQSRLERAAAEQTKLEGQMEQTKAKHAQKVEKTTREVTGLDRERVDRDDRRMTEIMKRATTWSDGEEYEANRSELIRVYGIPKDGQFMREYMSPSGKRQPDGKLISAIDQQKLNMSFGDMSTYVVKIDGVKYNYFARVTTTTKSAVGSGTSEKESIITYTTDPDGKILDLTAVPSTDDTDSSN